MVGARCDTVVVFGSASEIAPFMKSREKPLADVEIGHRSISLCHLVNITRDLGRKLRWNPETERFVDDAEADKMLDRPRRKGYELPS